MSPARKSTTVLRKDLSTSFTTRRVNATTFLIREDDAYGEHPFIYVKVYAEAGVVVVSDTGCDEPAEKHRNGMFLISFLLNFLWVESVH